MLKMIVLLTALSPVGTPPPGHEAWIETQWTQWLGTHEGLEDEVRLPDGSRVDVVQDCGDHDVSWEVDWTHKWPEAIGQAIYYSISLDNPNRPVYPGVWILKKREHKDEDYVQCLAVIQKLRAHGIKMHFRVTEIK